MFKAEISNKKQHFNEILIFIFLSYLITWLVVVPKALYSYEIISFKLPALLELIAAYGPALAAIIVMYLVYKKEGVVKLLSGLKIWRVGFRWYLIALLGQPLVWVIAIYLNLAIGGESPSFSNHFSSISMGYNILFFSLVFFSAQILSLFGEEVGWRGYLLPKLLNFTNWVIASFILGIIWSLWHLPLFFIADSTQEGLSIVWYIIDLMASALFFTWIYINTKQSLLIATLFHASINTSTVVIPILPMVAGDSRAYLIGVMLKIIIAIILILKDFNFSNKLKLTA